MDRLTTPLLPMDFPNRLTQLRKAKGHTQQSLGDAIGMSVIQIHRYESGASQPPLDVIRKLAVALSTTADELVFGDQERGPDDDLRLQFEAVSHFDSKDKEIAKALLDGLILKHEAKRWASSG